MVVRRIALLFACFTVAAAAHAQALPSASASGVSYQVGAGVAFGGPDYGNSHIQGVTAFANFDLPIGLGLDIEYHDLNLVTPKDIGEGMLVAGLRYGVAVKHFYPYVKGVAGFGSLNLQQGYYPTNSSTSYGIYGFGGGLDYRMRRHLMIRAIDFEYQDWAGFKPNGLTPYVITVGAGYRWH